MTNKKFILIASEESVQSVESKKRLIPIALNAIAPKKNVDSERSTPAAKILTRMKKVPQNVSQTKQFQQKTSK